MLTLIRLANICSMATLTAQSAELTALVKDDPSKHKIWVEVMINLALIALTTITNCVGVQVSLFAPFNRFKYFADSLQFYGKLERVSIAHIYILCQYIKYAKVIMWFKLGLLGLVCILMIAINAGGTSFFPEIITDLILIHSIRRWSKTGVISS